MLAETTTLIDEAIARLEMLRGVFADDFAVCRRAGTSDSSFRGVSCTRA